MIKVLYDHQTFSLQEYGGISRIFFELISRSNEYDTDTDLSVLFSNNVYLKGINLTKISSFFKTKDYRYKQQVLYALNKAYSIYKLKSQRFDIFHPTYYDPYFLKYVKKKPFVVTFHDLTHEKFAERYTIFSKDRLISEGKKVLINEASKIIAVSNSTKHDILKWYGIPEKMIEVIYLGSSLSPVSTSTLNRIVKDPYILFVGVRSLYKNFNFFLESIAPLLGSNVNLKLVCAGGGNFTPNEIEHMKSLGVLEKITHYAIDGNLTLQNLYVNALCFIFPSLYEGFGIPLLEAFSCGCPTAASDRSSLPEVGGNATVYFDPESAKSILEATVCLIEDNKLREEKILNGYKRLNLFSWDNTRKKTFDLYKSLV